MQRMKRVCRIEKRWLWGTRTDGLNDGKGAKYLRMERNVCFMDH